MTRPIDLEKLLEACEWEEKGSKNPLPDEYFRAQANEETVKALVKAVLKMKEGLKFYAMDSEGAAKEGCDVMLVNSDNGTSARKILKEVNQLLGIKE